MRVLAEAKRGDAPAPNDYTLVTRERKCSYGKREESVLTVCISARLGLHVRVGELGEERVQGVEEAWYV